ncbi:MAG: nfi [Phycisphaerales bacterium]|nr:nfi [Phycisphaerales bacterium]
MITQTPHPTHIAAIDVDYRPNATAQAAAVTFDDWQSPTPTDQLTVHVANIAPYIPGQFYLRELPCILAALSALSLPPTLIIIDGYVWLTTPTDPGLGAHLYNALNQTTPVIGVAKTQYHNALTAIPIARGQSKTPLYITAAGLDPHTAATHIQQMHGPHRLPTLLKLADTLSRQPAQIPQPPP